MKKTQYELLGDILAEQHRKDLELGIFLVPEATSHACECEHVDHFNNGHCHKYGAEFPRTAVVTTLWGKFTVCIECLEHLKNYVTNAEK